MARQAKHLKFPLLDHFPALIPPNNFLIKSGKRYVESTIDNCC